jgi:hypothetical protein
MRAAPGSESWFRNKSTIPPRGALSKCVRPSAFSRIALKVWNTICAAGPELSPHSEYAEDSGEEGVTAQNLVKALEQGAQLLFAQGGDQLVEEQDLAEERDPARLHRCHAAGSTAFVGSREPLAYCGRHAVRDTLHRALWLGADPGARTCRDRHRVCGCGALPGGCGRRQSRGLAAPASDGARDTRGVRPVRRGRWPRPGPSPQIRAGMIGARPPSMPAAPVYRLQAVEPLT